MGVSLSHGLETLTGEEAAKIVGLIWFAVHLTGIGVLHCLMSSVRKLFHVFFQFFSSISSGRINMILVNHS